MKLALHFHIAQKKIHFEFKHCSTEDPQYVFKGKVYLTKLAMF